MTKSWATQTVASLVAAYEPHANAKNALAMSAYMRNQFDYFGIPTPERRLLFRQVTNELTVPTESDLDRVARALYRRPERELQYCANELIRKYFAVCSSSFLESTIHDLLVTKSWWDSVDSLQSAAVGPLVQKYPKLKSVMRKWIKSDNRWLVRSAIIHQLAYRRETDEAMLFEFCTRRAADKEFFIAKAIGWSLREYAKTSPKAVMSFVNRTPELSSLARREAIRRMI